MSLMGTVILALLGGLGGAALAQDEASEPTTPAFFELVEETGDNDTWGIVTTDPRFSGTWVVNDPPSTPSGTAMTTSRRGRYASRTTRVTQQQQRSPVWLVPAPSMDTRERIDVSGRR